MSGNEIPDSPASPEPVSAYLYLIRVFAVFWILVISGDLTFGPYQWLFEAITPDAYRRLPLMTNSLKHTPPLERDAGRPVLETPNPQSIVVECSEIDQWGTPFRMVLTVPEREILRLCSSGPDRVSKSAGLDKDDITDAIAERELLRYGRIFEWCFSLVAFVWTVFLIWAIVIRKRKENWVY